MECLWIPVPRQMWNAMHQHEQQCLPAVFQQQQQQPLAGEENNCPPHLSLEGNRILLTHAELLLTPHTLNDLWTELLFVFGGRKPAKDFIREESGHKKKKFMYCRCKTFWDMVRRNVDAGVSAEVAIDRIYAAYGRQLSVTKILSAIIKDKPDGHLNLHP